MRIPSPNSGLFNLAIISLWCLSKPNYVSPDPMTAVRLLPDGFVSSITDGHQAKYKNSRSTIFSIKATSFVSWIKSQKPVIKKNRGYLMEASWMWLRLIGSGLRMPWPQWEQLWHLSMSAPEQVFLEDYPILMEIGQGQAATAILDRLKRRYDEWEIVSSG